MRYAIGAGYSLQTPSALAEGTKIIEPTGIVRPLPTPTVEIDRGRHTSGIHREIKVIDASELATYEALGWASMES